MYSKVYCICVVYVFRTGISESWFAVTVTGEEKYGDEFPPRIKG